MLPLSDDFCATCGSRLMQVGNTAMTERLNSGCAIQVLKRLRGGARMGNGMASLDSGNVWHVVRTDVGPPVLVVTDVLSLVVLSLRHMVVVQQRMFFGPWSCFPSSKQKVVILRFLVRWSLVWCLVHWVRLPFLKVRGQTPWVWCPLSWHGPSVRAPCWCKCFAPYSFTRALPGFIVECA